MSGSTAATILGNEIGLTVLAAATTDQEANEGFKDHGLFTYVIANGLAGKDGVIVKAPVDNDGTVSASGLLHYVMKEVPPLAEAFFKKAQTPTAVPNGEDFAITKVK
jgi:hypothetical protein